ncbi:MAG TPA: RagB/SusD family nutrient uptake outer membrane protein [Chitinophagaceae bacterium]|nr:RagB/SusD family nutrient uptake outer membrane protein [Chitinophagaceae bacterium]
MKKIINYIILGTVIFTLTNCKGFLDVKPQGVITVADVSKPEAVDGLVIAAYAWIPHEATLGVKLSPWLADIKSDDSYKGGGGLSDQAPWYQMEVFSLVTSNVGNNDGCWYGSYEGISRCNAALTALDKLTTTNYPLKDERIAEMRFLRGVMYLQLKRWYKWIPYFTEKVTADSIKLIPNHPDTAKNDLFIWNGILQDFVAAAKVLPATQSDKGRPTKYAAEAEAANCLMWMAYEENDKNEVVNINKATLRKALTYLDDIINSKQYSLTPEFAHNFLAKYDNNTTGSIWEWQYSHDDGTPNGNLNGGTPLNAPWWPPYFSCCDFHKPSYNMVNAFRVGNNGLPLFNTFNDEDIKNKDAYFADNSWDPRIGHTVGIPGLPWKYQTNLLFDSSGSRTPVAYGYFSSLKENVQAGSPYLVNLFWMWNSKNVSAIRYDRVLLWKAEILIQLDREKEALPIINEIRQRAANSTTLLKFANGKPTLPYKIALYQDGVNCNWTHDFAWQALMWEDRLEFAMEGERWYDIVRWGIAGKVMNAYFAKEKRRDRSWLDVAHFTPGRDEYMPIPQNQMHWAEGVYKQNAGY